MSIAGRLRIDFSCLLFVAFALVAFLLPVDFVQLSGDQGQYPLGWFEGVNGGGALAFPVIVAFALIGFYLWKRPHIFAASALLTMAAVLGALPPLLAIGRVFRGFIDFADPTSLEAPIGLGAVGIWVYVFGLGFLVWRAMSLLSEAASQRDAPRVLGLLVNIWLTLA